MPPLPELSFLGDDRSYGYDAEDMHAYARAYAAEQTRELVEAVKGVVEWMDAPDESAFSDAQLAELRALIAKHKGAA